MKPSKEILSEIESLKEDANDFLYFNKSIQLKKALLSEEFKNQVLPQFLPLTKECIEKAPESFFITLHSGQRYVYYCSTARLVPIYKKGKKGKTIYLTPNYFLKYFSFLKKQP